MANGDVKMIRFPLAINPTSPPDAATTLVAATAFVATIFPEIFIDVVKDPGVNPSGLPNYVLVITGIETS